MQSSILIRAYYWATVGFLILDYLFGINVRLAFLDDRPEWRWIYYLVCFTCLAIMLWRPAWSTLVATIESILALSLLIISFGSRVITYSDPLAGGTPVIVTPAEIVNFMISGAAAWLSWWQGMHKMREDMGDSR